VEVSVEAGRGIVEPELLQRTRAEALSIIRQLRESW
jgi:hypothetical protein